MGVPINLSYALWRTLFRHQSVDDVGDQERMVLLPEEMGQKGFLESSPPTFRDRLFQKKACARTVFRVPA
ncbi:hypothetical protein TNCV_385871 [Trichonephila clavipes]|nr:hypothetical protein TNCV_385871 [Trichonephila clavipes]